MSAQEIDSIFGEEQTKQDELVAKARIQLEAMKEKTGERPRRTWHDGAWLSCEAPVIFVAPKR